MKLVALFAALFFTTAFAFAQKKIILDEYAATDRKALQIPDSLTTTTSGIAKYIRAGFLSDKDKVRAIFIWTASNIAYSKMSGANRASIETKEERISTTLRCRKGVCQNYAEVFTDICTKAGIKSYVIVGYTKKQGVLAEEAHAWSAARIYGDWYLFDPTWGAGFLFDDEFIPKLNTGYFLVKPEAMIKSHMPFDYLWQLLPYPVSTKQFLEGETEQKAQKPVFHFNDSISVYNTLSPAAQLASEARRITANGVSNVLVFDHLQIALANAAVENFNFAVNRFNEFVEHYNRQFNPHKPDAEVVAMLADVETGLSQAKSFIGKGGGAGLGASADLPTSIHTMQSNLAIFQDWHSRYLKKGKFWRGFMFSNFAWSGYATKPQ